jgi:probable phosphoglycerate mutase
LLRHGATEWSHEELHTGRAEPPLSADGRRQAEEAGQRLAGQRFEHVLVSPQLRARQTCELAGFADQAEVCEALVEWDYGRYEGMTDDDSEERRPGWDLFRDGAPGGESPQAVEARCGQVLEHVAGLEGRCLLVGHGKLLRSLAARWLELDIVVGAALPMDPGALSVLEREDGRPLLRLWNYTGTP